MPHDAPDTPADLPFDQVACFLLRDACDDAFRLCPPLRSVGITLDYYGTLNDADVFKTVWLERNPAGLGPDADPAARPSRPPTALDALFGGLFSTQRLFQLQAERALHAITQLRDLAAEYGKEATAAHEELARLQRAIAALAPHPAAADPGPGEPPPAAPPAPD